MLGIMSLDLSSPLELHFSSTEEEEAKILEAIKEFLVFPALSETKTLPSRPRPC